MKPKPLFDPINHPDHTTVVESVMMSTDAQDQFETHIEDTDLREFGLYDGRDDQR